MYYLVNELIFTVADEELRISPFIKKNIVIILYIIYPGFIKMHKYSLFILLLLLISSTIYSQQLSSRQLDSLYDCVLKIKRPDLLTNKTATVSSVAVHRKSATGLINAVRMQLQYFTGPQKSVLQSILQGPTTDTSFVTPGGFFRIFFNNKGESDVPTYSMDSLAIALDSVYKVEVDFIGFPAPPPSDGDTRYDVYVQNIVGDYSYTTPETEYPAGTGRYTSYIEINNDYTGFYTTGLNAAKVSCAHEFDHAINIGNYINRYFAGDEFFYELSATAMEHFVFPYIKDYLQYLPPYFENTQNSIALSNAPNEQEFALGIWHIYLRDKFGDFRVIKKEWSLMPAEVAMDCINDALQYFGSSLGTELNTFGVWMYYTNYRTVPGKYFEDAAYYPLITPVSTLNFSNGLSFQLETGPSSNCFVSIINPGSLDTLITIVTNSDVQDAIDNTDSLYSFNASYYSSAAGGAKEITSNYYINFSASNSTYWTNGEILNNIVISSGQSLAGQINYVFPSPFSYSKNAYLYIPVSQVNDLNIQFSVYTIAMKLVYSSSQSLTYFNGQKVIKWDGRNSGEKKLPTGVYIYVVKNGGGLTKGKLVIFNQ